MTTYRALLAAAALLAVVALVLHFEQHERVPAVVADPVRTPGVLNPDVTQATIGSTICRRGWTHTIRPPVEYTNALKKKQMRTYAESGRLSDYQEDHLISLELRLSGHPGRQRDGLTLPLRAAGRCFPRGRSVAETA